MPPDYCPQDIGLAGLDGGAAMEVNDHGAVLVNLWRETVAPGSNRSHWSTNPFIWTQERGFTVLPVPEGYSSVVGFALNQHGTVLLGAERWSRPAEETESFLVHGGTLRELPGPPGAREVEYHGLSDRGWLIGTARPAAAPNDRRSFVAEPVR
ncbi:MAG: hypothetical protein HY721_23425 [Planctomycetes bacterium]|nr:hypothetical protein [Planctomycetota bacterium]